MNVDEMESKIEEEKFNKKDKIVWIVAPQIRMEPHVQIDFRFPIYFHKNSRIILDKSNSKITKSTRGGVYMASPIVFISSVYSHFKFW